MSDLWSAVYERLTLTRQQLRAWFSRAFSENRMEGVHPDFFWDEAPVRPKRGEATPQQPQKRRFRLTGEGGHTLLLVKHNAPGMRLYFDHVTERQLEWMGRGRRDVTGKRVPIYGDMVLRTNPEALIDVIVRDERLWDDLRRVVMPQLAQGDRRAIEWRRYWVHAHLAAPFSHWVEQPVELQTLIHALGTLATRIEGVEQPVVP